MLNTFPGLKTAGEAGASGGDLSHKSPPDVLPAYELVSSGVRRQPHRRLHNYATVHSQMFSTSL
jgi:hypothetical protein